jgi:hypothetical protein
MIDHAFILNPLCCEPSVVDVEEESSRGYAIDWKISPLVFAPQAFGPSDRTVLFDRLLMLLYFPLDSGGSFISMHIASN